MAALTVNYAHFALQELNDRITMAQFLRLDWTHLPSQSNSL